LILLVALLRCYVSTDGKHKIRRRPGARVANGVQRSFRNEEDISGRSRLCDAVMLKFDAPLADADDFGMPYAMRRIGRDARGLYGLVHSDELAREQLALQAIAALASVRVLVRGHVAEPEHPRCSHFIHSLQPPKR
jgi:hypothetical protein